MAPSLTPSDASPPDLPPQQQQPSHQKRTRVLLSCGPCRYSKLKCDREQPCSQCTKKGRDDLCQYAPRPVRKQKPAKGVSARLKRLEGMVRGMMDGEGDLQAEALLAAHGSIAQPPVQGSIVKGERGTTYVGATHCMAMLEDIQDLKSYFDDAESEDDGNSPSNELDAAEMLLFSRGAPRNREELLAHLPERNVTDRLITRYFAAMSPSQHIIHRPTFTKAYARFWQDPSGPSMHWIAQLFLIVATGTFFNSFASPHETPDNSPMTTSTRVSFYRSCAAWALIWGKYMQPTAETLPAFLLYLETHFVFNRGTQMPCYILAGVCIRIMFKMGLHRDPSKLANISPFEGEMRRRMWNMATQLDLLVSFHMGLPSMVQGIESDTGMPRNLQEEDFGEDSKELPPARPPSDYTLMTYPINKTRILRVFGRIAQQAHSLTPPIYSDVMHLDSLLQKMWQEVPAYMHVRPLEDCIGDAPALLVHRFGLAALYNKSRCVLHRRYLAEPMLNHEHDYSRRQCIEGATALLDYQYIIWKATRPGNILSDYGWFVSSLAVHDFLLAAMIIYLCIQNEHYAESDPNFEWMVFRRAASPTKQELRDMMKRSHFIWSEVSSSLSELRKTADTLAVMLARIGCPVDTAARADSFKDATWNTSASHYDNGSTTALSSNAPASSTDTFENESDLFSSLGLGGSASGTAKSTQSPFSLGQDVLAADLNLTGMPLTGSGTDEANIMNFDTSWMESANSMDWRFLDTSFSHSYAAGIEPSAGPSWIERFPVEGRDSMEGIGF